MVQDNSVTESGEEDSTVSLHDIVESSRVIAETASDAIITINEQSIIQFVNRAAGKIFGYAKEEMLGAELTILMPEYLRHLHRSGLKNYLETGQKHISWEAIELPGLRKDGKEILLEVSFGEFRKADRHFFTGIARDITKRKHDENRLAALQKVTDAALAHLSLDDLLSESLDRIREVLNVDTVAVLLLETEGDELVAWAAKGLEEEVEQGVHIPVGKGFAGRLVAHGKPIIIDDVSQADVYNPLLREKGIKSLLGVPLFIEGRPIGVLHVGKLELFRFTDEDVRLLELAGDRIALAIEHARLYQVEKNARADAESANRAKDEFLTILSHELRTPLTPIIGWVHMMQSGMLPETEFLKALSVVNRNAYSLKRLINDLLDMSAILSGKMRIEETNVSLASVLQESIESMRSYATDSKVQLKLKIQDEAAASIIKGDPNRLNQAFSNIIHNAIKFSASGKTVNVTCGVIGSEATIRIRDHGEGIPADFLAHVFDRFRQADGSRTRAYGGLGLGLSLVKSFIEAHHGKVEATSEGQGKGSVFVVTLPLVGAPPVATRDSEQRPGLESQRRPIRILLVEDQPDTLEMLTAGFQSKGYEVSPCTSAAEALSIADRDNFDVLVSDIAMPGMDGLQLIESLRQKPNLKNIPAIALTGYASKSDAEAAIAAGFQQHLSKPIDPVDLAAAVESTLAASRNKES